MINDIDPYYNDEILEVGVQADSEVSLVLIEVVATVGGGVQTVNSVAPDAGGDVELTADNIPETVNRFWLTAALKAAWDSTVDWIAENGAALLEHLTDFANPHKTSVSNLEGFPLTPQGKFMKDDRSFDYPNVGGGGSGAPIYMSDLSSDIAGYKKLTSTPDAAETIKTITANAGTVSGEAYLFDLPIGISLLNAGAFQFGYYRAVSNAAGESFKQLELFLYHTTGPNAGTETVLGFFESSEINDTVLTERFITRSSTQNYVVDPTDRFGVRSKFRTTRNADTTLSYVVGGQRAWYMVPPIPPRHDDTRDKNGNPDYLHLDYPQKFEGALATGNATLNTVKKVADYAEKIGYNKIIDLDYTVSTTGVVQISIANDSKGGLLSDYNLRKISLYCYLETNATVTGKRLGISVNNVLTTTYKQSTSLAAYLLSRIGASGIYRIDLEVIGGMLAYRLVGDQSSSKVNDSTLVGVTTINGVNMSISSISSIQLFVLASESTEFSGKIKILGIYE